MFFNGVVCVGTQRGHVYLVDLAMDKGSDVGASWEEAQDKSETVKQVKGSFYITLLGFFLSCSNRGPTFLL